jgi:hypothetical protein
MGLQHILLLAMSSHLLIGTDCFILRNLMPSSSDRLPNLRFQVS